MSALATELKGPIAWLDESRLGAAVEHANREQRPLYLLILATKPCYIKLASLALALEAGNVPFLLIDSGQHYDPELTQAKHELGYEHLLTAVLGIRGSLLKRTAQLALCVEQLDERLQGAGIRQPVVPLVSGDTATAAMFSQFWYIAHGVRAVHVEAGLRSYGPDCPGGWQALQDLCEQRKVPWQRFRDEPFPEGVNTALASVVSDLLLAPVLRNVEQLRAEDYDTRKIRHVGSLSSDAVRLALPQAAHSRIFQLYPVLETGRWLRVDLHRRENMTPTALRAVLLGLARLAGDGVQVVLIQTNALNGALVQHDLGGLLDEACQQGVVVQAMWPHYTDVIHFLTSVHCLALYTDSGGLQEEANVLGVPCLTCRLSTDRPETVLDAQTNLLLPPLSADFVHRHLSRILAQSPASIWPGLSRPQRLYGHAVGERIVELLKVYQAPAPLPGARAQFLAREV
ncbi:UDP-N-acetylglucosamine 2-epimerase [Pseudomonas lactucae]|uniref:UDP-N-acetylglucosamine 2-epimerase n=1 Tax=Pseudomonas lactucae TaxID=2813360 RepID=A0A9X0YAP2_9PSED|nr:UDP-N-acetylglucosamine 2-epimerase [Pseudomonas lactucae]MBN2975662.1 UDP-N-acetylglucosamine 2-epimerase [Pseudomonas lactucae]MBN2989013.1 UDP-N-acetylglucosamine 2-epimerase [Pseudomonas lactucae]